MADSKISAKELGFSHNYFKNELFGQSESVKIDKPLVDEEDEHLLERFHWRKGKECGWYRRFREEGKHKTIYLHREILNVSGNQSWQVFFADSNKSNCRRSNLQLLTMQQARTRN